MISVAEKFWTSMAPLAELPGLIESRTFDWSTLIDEACAGGIQAILKKIKITP